MARRHHIRPHPDCPKELRRLYRECQRSIARMEAQLHVNRCYIWALLKNGKVPANPAIARKLFIEPKLLLRRGVDRRRKHVRAFEALNAQQQDQILEFWFHYKEDEPMPESKPVEPVQKYGACCACGTTDPAAMVRNVIMLDYKMPVMPGSGWGCVACHLPLEGAVAIVCDHCLEANAPIRFAVAGYLSDHLRVPIEQLAGEHRHNLALHPELQFEFNAELARKGRRDPIQ